MSFSRPVPGYSRPGATLPRCPRQRVLDYEASWHVLPGAPKLLICTCCFADRIKTTPFASLFTRVVAPQGRCHFQAPRVLSLWSIALQSNDTSPLVEYAQKRSPVPDCPGLPGAMHGVVEWYYTPDVGHSLFSLCEACYEDYVAGTAFAVRFARCGGPGGTEVWSCDFSVPAIRIAFGYNEERNSWGAFAEAARRRMGLPACGSGGQMKTLRVGGTGLEMSVCGACYEDNIPLRQFEGKFEVAGDRTQGEEDMCSFATPALAFAYGIALEHDDFEIFKTAAAAILGGVSCGGSGDILGALRYGFIGDDIFDVCPGCYAGVVTPLSPASSFKVKHAGGKPCALRAGFFDFDVCVRHLREAADKVSLETFLSWAREVADTAPCPGSTLTPGLEWYGWGECTICPGCYHTVAHGTSLTPTFTLRKTTVGELTTCCLYSAQMRQRYNDACTMGDPADLLEFARSRRAAYDSMVAHTEWRAQDEAERVRMAEYYLAMNVQGRIQDSIAGITADFDEHEAHLYGNDDLGWYQTEFGVEAEMYDRMANLLLAEDEGQGEEESRRLWESME